jgi:transposase
MSRRRDSSRRREWVQEKIADALQVTQSTVSKDLAAGDYSSGINKPGRGRPRNLTDEQADQVIENT